MKELIIFENVHKNILEHKDSAHIIFGEEGRFKVIDKDENKEKTQDEGKVEAKVIFDILFHSITNPSDDDSIWIKDIKENADIIIPYFPFSDYDKIVQAVYVAHKEKPFLKVFAGLRTKPVKLTNPRTKDKILHESLSFYEIQPAIFNNEEVGKEVALKSEYNKYSIIEREKFCELLFTDPSGAKSYFSEQIEKIDKDYIEQISAH